MASSSWKFKRTVAPRAQKLCSVAQWVAGGLLLMPRTAMLGALVYLPIIVNIFAITLAIGPSFAGTRIVTGAMLAANLYLLFWDWDRWRGILSVAAPADGRHGDLITALGLMIAASLGLRGVVSAHLARLHHGSFTGPLTMVAIAALLGVAILVVAYRRAKRFS